MQQLRFFWWAIFLLFGCFSNLTGQVESLDLRAYVYAEKDQSPLPYANVYNVQQETGTPTNLAGYFELPYNQIGDTIIISYVGYRDYVLVVNLPLPKTIYLSPNSALLDEVVVTAESNWLYDMLARVRKNRRTETRNAKTYFYLETDLGDDQVEVIEAYYNGRYENFGTKSLAFKKGRIGLRPAYGRYYSSTSSSRIFTMHDLFSVSPYFPTNPLQLSGRSMKRQFDLQLQHSYQEGDAAIYVIDFNPRDSTYQAFRGTVWVDRNKHQVRKINLRITNADIHPFIPIGYNTIIRVDMNITKTYKRDAPYIDAIDFAYEVTYEDLSGQILTAKTTSFTKAYDYKELFQLPNFTFTKQLYEDYRNITATDYDISYWTGSREYRFYDRAAVVDTFIRQNVVRESILYPEREEDSEQQLPYPYLRWDTTRFKMEVASDSLIKAAESRGRFAINRYNLNAKLFLDANWVNDSLIFQTETILDPIGTFYYFYITNKDLAYMNMYLDLLEIQRRKLETQLAELKTFDRQQINELYQQRMDAFRQELEVFNRQVNRGTIVFRLKEWNNKIKEALGVDNLAVFPLKPPEEDE
ncbi:MAG: carboxypeptidase-like regulatory domain-containing protein [Bacteroidota bacterium]